MLIMDRDTWTNNLTSMKTTLWNALTLILLKTALPVDDNTTIADVTDVANECDFSGYARKTAIALTGPVYGDDGIAELLSPVQVFTHNGGATANTVQGYAVVDAAVGALMGLAMFDEPVALAALNDTLAFVFKLNYPSPTSGAILTE